MQLPHPGFELGATSPYPMNLAITPRASLSDGEVPVREVWGMWNTPSSPLLPGPLWSGVVVLVRVPSMG